MPQTAELRAKFGVAPRRRRLLSISEIKRVDFASGKQTHLLVCFLSFLSYLQVQFGSLIGFAYEEDRIATPKEKSFVSFQVLL